MLKPYSPCDSIWRWGHWEVIRVWQNLKVGPHDGVNDLIKSLIKAEREREFSLSEHKENSCEHNARWLPLTHQEEAST
jgi:hypothetical protein